LTNGIILVWVQDSCITGNGNTGQSKLPEKGRKNESKYYWYDFTVRGERYLGSTKVTNETRAQMTATLKSRCRD